MTLHCWEDGPRRLVLDETGYPVSEVGSTCMLEAGHDGDHDWTPDDEIGVSFAPSGPSDSGGKGEGI